jgi:hypothetical protein
MASSGNFTSHDPRVISVFEIIGAYFTDTMYNHVYHSAKTNVTSGSSVTDEYVRRIQAYVVGVKGDATCYRDVVQGVHTYFTGTTRYTTLSFAEFVDRIIGICVPEEYFRQFAPQDKDELLSSVICDLVSNLASFATKPDMLRRIIDGHRTTPEVTIRMLQDAAVNALITKRAALHNKFLRKMGQARDQVSMDVVDDMKKALRRLLREKAAATSRADEAERTLDHFKNQVKAGKLREAKLLKLVNLMRRGRDEGPAAAGVSLRIPQRERIAEEDPLDFEPPRKPPRRERIAEVRDEDEDEDEDEDDEGDEDDEVRDDDEYEVEDDAAEDPRQRTAAKPRAATIQAVPASFFKTVTERPAVTATSLRPAVTATSLRPAVTTPPLRPAVTTPPTGSFSSMFDNVVDSAAGDDDLDQLLYGDNP